ncbi:MAG: ATP-binding protein [Deltaproteobacteria bacterium]|nr:ATP-binding protein [Deltaproteobacteria bacterium]
MKTAFVATTNHQRLLAAVAAVQRRAAREAGLILVTGHPGLGKTKSVRRFAIEHGAVYLRGKAHWTEHSALRELCVELGDRHPPYGRDRLFHRVVERLAAAGFPALVVDEADHLFHDSRTLETFRDLNDTTECVVIMVGMEALHAKVAKYPQVASRVGRVVEYQPATIDDVRALAGLAEVRIGADLVDHITTASNGKIRLALNALSVAEAHAKTNGLAEIGLAQTKDLPMIYEFQGPRPKLRALNGGNHK